MEIPKIVLVLLCCILVVAHLCSARFKTYNPGYNRRRGGNSFRRRFSLQSRIIGGRPARPNEFPYQTQIIVNGRHTCGGVLVLSPTTGKQIVLTAAHCIFPQFMSGYRIRAGLLNIDDPNAQTRLVERAVVHPNYDEKETSNDIAIIFLKEDFDLDESVQPIGLPRQKNEALGKELTTTGWGTITDALQGRPTAKRLQVLHHPLVSNKKCGEILRRQTGDSPITPTVLCVGNLEGEQSSCFGDSGGPVTSVDKRGRTFVAGVASFVMTGCAVKSFPTVFTRISSYLTWIGKTSKQYTK